MSSENHFLNPNESDYINSSHRNDSYDFKKNDESMGAVIRTSDSSSSLEKEVVSKRDRAR